MSAIARKAVAAYARTGVETRVATADPHGLIVMLYDGAQIAISQARVAIERDERAAKAAAVTKAIAILDEGLKASLDPGAGGQLAERLASLYDYMCRRLAYANLHGDLGALDEVSRLLGDLREAWVQIGRGDSAARERQA